MRSSESVFLIPEKCNLFLLDFDQLKPYNLDSYSPINCA